MTCTIQQKCDVFVGPDKVTSKANPSFSDLKDVHSKESLWMEGSCNFLWREWELGMTAIPVLNTSVNDEKELCTLSGSKFSDRGTAFTNSLRACSRNKDLQRGIKIHENILKRGLHKECSDALITMYAKCSELKSAQDLLNKYGSRDVITWTSMIAGYNRAGKSEDALNCFECMQNKGIPANAVTYACVLKACASIGASEKGEEIHNLILHQDLLIDDRVLGNALVDMYAKCGDFSKAQDVLQNLPFRDVVSWSALIAGYAKEGQAEQALKCFHRMQHEGIRPNAVTYACILKAYAALGALNEGEKIHDVVKNQGLLQNNVELGTALVDMYAKCGALSKAKCVFDSLLHRDVVCWNALIVGYTDDGQGEQALDCFKRMKHDGITPNATTYACILKACASIGACDEGQKIHDEIERQGLLEVDIMVGNALVDMYAKCGKLSKAQKVLHQLPFRDVVSWNALITGFAQGGLGEQALSCFEKMQSEGISPDAVSFLCILNVCSHLGLVDKGYEYFVNMTTKYGIIPNSECFTCIIDLFGRAGHLEKAVQLIQEMPVFDRSANWIALLSASHKWGDIKVGRLAYEQAAQVDKMHGPAVLLMANMYSSAEGEINKRNKIKPWKELGIRTQVSKVSVPR